MLFYFVVAKWSGFQRYLESCHSSHLLSCPPPSCPCLHCKETVLHLESSIVEFFSFSFLNNLLNSSSAGKSQQVTCSDKFYLLLTSALVIMSCITFKSISNQYQGPLVWKRSKTHHLSWRRLCSAGNKCFTENTLILLHTLCLKQIHLIRS